MRQELGRTGKEFALPSWASSYVEKLGRHDPETLAHSRRVAFIAGHLWEDYQREPQNEGRLFRITDEVMYRASMLHDIGKLGISRAVLDKPGPLTDEEKAQMVRHTEGGYERVAPFDLLSALILRGHHGWGKNGLVYDNTLSATDDPEIREAQIVMAVADKTDATHERGPNGNCRSPEEVSIRMHAYFEKELEAGIVSEAQLQSALGYALLLDGQ